jgi:hypothetical protein
MSAAFIFSLFAMGAVRRGCVKGSIQVSSLKLGDLANTDGAKARARFSCRLLAVSKLK